MASYYTEKGEMYKWLAVPQLACEVEVPCLYSYWWATCSTGGKRSNLWYSPHNCPICLRERRGEITIWRLTGRTVRQSTSWPPATINLLTRGGSHIISQQGLYNPRNCPHLMRDWGDVSTSTADHFWLLLTEWGKQCLYVFPVGNACNFLEWKV